MVWALRGVRYGHGELRQDRTRNGRKGSASACLAAPGRAHGYWEHPGAARLPRVISTGCRR